MTLARVVAAQAAEEIARSTRAAKESLDNKNISLYS
jgi:hypothetical protein